MNSLTASANTTMALAAGNAASLAMTDAVQIQMIGAVFLFLGSVVTGWFAYKSKVNSQEAKEIAHETGKAVNGKMEEFKKMAEAFYRAQGRDEGVSATEAKAALASVAKAEGREEGRAEPPKVALQPAIGSPPAPLPAPTASLPTYLPPDKPASVPPVLSALLSPPAPSETAVSLSPDHVTLAATIPVAEMPDDQLSLIIESLKTARPSEDQIKKMLAALKTELEQRPPPAK